MAERAQIPPKQKMVLAFTTPNHRNGVFSEVVSKESPRYQTTHPIKRGTLYSSIPGGDIKTSDSYDPLYFLRESRYGSSDTEVVWSWGTDPQAEDSFNSTIEYSGDWAAAPIYTRVYTLRREVLEASYPLTYGSALTSLIAIKVTNGGAGYTNTDTVNISGGLGATAELVVDKEGVIQSIIVTASGSGYDSAALPAITFSAANGAGATAVAVVQPKTAVLVKQFKQELSRDSSFTSQDTDSPLANEYARYITIWETLPGPWLFFTRWSESLGPIQGRRRAILNTGTLTASLTATAKTTYEARDGSSVVAWQIEETNSNGTGSAGNPAYPILVRKGFDPETGAAMTTTSQVVVLPASPDAIGSAAGAGYVIDSEIVPINAFLGTKITVTMAIPETRTEYESIGFQFPALFVFLGSWAIPGICTIQGPYAGVNYTLSAHRTASKPGATVISYTNGPPGALPATWNVTTPGNASRIFPIQDNTIHNVILINEWCDADPFPGHVVESLPASTPSSYTPGDSLTIRAGTRRWRGNMWEKKVVSISE